jgi:hypothetical protein
MAFAQFEIMNEISKQSLEANQYSSQRYFNQILQLSENWSNRTKIKWSVIQSSIEQPTLAFLVGFPRSGTTLLDTMLQSHPDVCVVEEKPMVLAMNKHLGSLATADRLTSLSERQIGDLRRVYFEELYSHITPHNLHRIIIDKHPLNLVNIAIIHRVFPNSKFILALRNPCDCVLSCFMQNFNLNEAMVNFLTLQRSATLYNAVMNLWDYYNNALDLEVEVLKYEELVENLKDTVEPLLNFLNLKWDDNVLNFQQTALSRGKINTASYNQVTQSIYVQASGRWQNYKDQLKGVIPILEPWVNKFNY